MVSPAGDRLGVLPSVPVASPWWQDIEPLNQAVLDRYGIEITVLRLLTVGEPGPSGVEITYLAETRDPVRNAEPWGGELADHPLRLPYARPGGPAADLAWAKAVLTDRGFIPVGPAVQVRTWNLSSLWRIPVEGQTLWLKATPPFLSHEGAVLAALAGGPVPRLLGRDGGRILMPEVPGSDLYEAATPELPPMTALLVELQRDWIGRERALLDLGLPDWRAPALIPVIRTVIARNAGELNAEDRAILARFADDLPERFAKIDACGLPDTLVHGDFHPGNLRGDGAALTVLDWGDSGVGHPLLDQPAFLGRIRTEAVDPSRRRWHDAWRAAAPGSDPDRASDLLAPISAARQTIVYQGFLDGIEPSEHPYHRADPAERLAFAAALLRAEA